MKLAMLLLISLLALPSGGQAACSGTDLRDSLTADQTAALQQRMADMPFAQGNHWVATKGPRTLHIIGTLHIDDPRLDPVTARLAPVITEADLLLVEATKAEEKALKDAVATRPEVVFIRTGPTLIEQMNAQDWSNLAAAAQVRGIPGFMAAKFQPWYLSLVLGMPPCILKDLAGGPKGLDHRLQILAEDAGTPIAALEPWDTLFSIFGKAPMDEQIDMLKLSVIPVQAAEDAVATLVAQYFDQQHGAVMETSRIIARGQTDMDPEAFDAAFDDLLDGLLVARNRAWMDVIATHPGNSIVIAAGAGHLSGRDGVLELLRLQGYTLTRHAF